MPVFFKELKALKIRRILKKILHGESYGHLI